MAPIITAIIPVIPVLWDAFKGNRKLKELKGDTQFAQLGVSASVYALYQNVTDVCSMTTLPSCLWDVNEATLCAVITGVVSSIFLAKRAVAKGKDVKGGE